MSGDYRSSALYDEEEEAEELAGNYDSNRPQGISGLVKVNGLVQVNGLVKVNGLVQVGATIQHQNAAAKSLIEDSIKHLHFLLPWWPIEAIVDLIGHSYHPAEGKKLHALHAATKAKHASGQKLHGLVMVNGLVQMGGEIEVSGDIVVSGKINNPFDKFFSQFDPTWPKAKFGGMVRQAITMAASVVGIQAGPIIDSFANMASNASPHHDQPPPPVPAHILANPPPGMMIGKHHKRWTTGEKVAAGIGGAVVAYGLYRLFKPKRAANPRRRKRNRRRNARRRR